MPSLKKLKETWGTFPLNHKKRFWQALVLYFIFCITVAVWISINADEAIKNWESRIPSSQTVIKNIETFDSIAQSFQQKSHSSELGKTVSNIQPSITIIMSGLGLSTEITERALNTLPDGISLVFSPYTDNLKDWMSKASQARYETLIFMPMETAEYPRNDPGPRALSSRLSNKDNEENLKWILEKGRGSIGVVNYMGSRFLTDKKRLLPVFEKLHENAALFIETTKTDNSQAAFIAKKVGLPYLSVDLKIDDTVTEKSIKKKIAQLEKIAQEKGYAIGIAEPYPLTLNTIKSWAPELAKRGIALSSLASVWKNKPAHDKRTSSTKP